MTSSAERLPRTICPRHYDLTLEPDLDTAVFRGRVSITVDVEAPAEAVICNALDLVIESVELHDRDGTVALAASLDAEREWLVAAAPRPITTGPARVDIAFRGELNDKLRGFYRSAFTDDTGVEHRLATTQFEATDARRAFPCWDEPDRKATFGITLVVPPGLLAVSNSPVVSDEPLADGRRRVVFAPTMAMSTYLVAFVVGPLAATEPIDADGVPVRVIARPDRLHLAPAALDIARFSLRYLSDYFDRPYPAAKLDLVAIPDFAFGAMENVGCVTFRETALLIDPDAASHHEMQRVVDVIAHEIAHMWFGNLVTMRWWNGIWLNEAFATFMETKTTDAYRPDWQRWNDFCLARSQAFDIDSLGSTRPVEFDVRSPADAEAMFDVLTYEKGGAVVRMLEQYLGEDRFRAGIRHYIERHAFGNTDTNDLWAAIESITGEPVQRIMHEWIFRGGYPVVAARAVDGGSVELAQRPFRFDTTAAAPAGAWPIPLRLRVTDGHTTSDQRVLLERDRAEVALDGGATHVVTLNADASGFYRAAPTRDDIDRIGRDGPQGLSALERYTLVDDAFALSLAGELEAADVLRLLQGLAHEVDLSVWERMVGVLDSLWRAVAPDRRGDFEAHAQALLRPKYDQLAGFALDDERLQQLRAVLFGALGRLASDAVALVEARRLFTQGGADPALEAAAISVVAAHASRAEHDELHRRFRAATSPQDEERYRYALVETPDPAAFTAALSMTLSGEIRTQDAPYVLARAMANRHHGFAAWEFVRARWDEVNTRFPSNSIARMISGIVALAEPAEAAAVEAFLAGDPVAREHRTIDQHRERLAISARFRARERPRLSEFLRPGPADR